MPPMERYWKKNRFYVYNADEKNVNIATEIFLSQKYTHIYYIMDMNYWKSQCYVCWNFGTIDDSADGVYKFLYNIKNYNMKQLRTKVHFILVRRPGISKLKTMEFKNSIRKTCRHIGIPEHHFFVETVENFYIKEDNGMVARITAVPNSDSSDLIKTTEMFDKQLLLRIAGTEPESIVDGIGMRYVIFTQGCPHHCKECHNPETWDYQKGRFITVPDLVKDIIKNPMLQGVTFSGGEPFMQPKVLVQLITTLRFYRNINKKPLDFTIYTGFTLNQLKSLNNLMKEPFGKKYLKHDNYWRLTLLNNVDYIIDGPFMKDKKSLSCKFRGSTNQKMYQVQKDVRGTAFVEIYPVDE